MRTNPHENSEQKSDNAASRAFLLKGTVSSVPEDQGGGLHHVSVQEKGVTVAQAAPVLPTVHGDYYVPPAGAPVMVAKDKKRQYSVLSAAVPNVETPALTPGERIVSHPLSTAHVKFNADGSLDIQGANKIRINGGGVGAVTDVRAASTNAEGGITELDIIRNPNVTLPE